MLLIIINKAKHSHKLCQLCNHPILKGEEQYVWNGFLSHARCEIERAGESQNGKTGNAASA